MRNLFVLFGLLAVFTLCDLARAQPVACDIADITWQLGPNMPEFRKGGCATVLDGKVISVFGMRQPWGEMSTMYLFDFRSPVELVVPRARRANRPDVCARGRVG